MFIKLWGSGTQEKAFDERMKKKQFKGRFCKTEKIRTFSAGKNHFQTFIGILKLFQGNYNKKAEMTEI